MAAFLTSHTFTPRVAPRRASVFATPRVSRRRSIRLAAAAARAAAAAGEILFFLWTLLALAFSLLIMAGFLE
jgi:hypothetical protein